MWTGAPMAFCDVAGSNSSGCSCEHCILNVAIAYETSLGKPTTSLAARWKTTPAQAAGPVRCTSKSAKAGAARISRRRLEILLDQKIPTANPLKPVALSLLNVNMHI